MTLTTTPKKEATKEATKETKKDRVRREELAPRHPESRLRYFTGMTVKDFVETLKLGIHYGWPSKKLKREGDITYEYQGGQWRPVDDEQYRIRPSCYEPTARSILAAAHLRPVCELDVPTWEMMGEPKLVLVYRCTIYTLLGREEVAEGRGAVRVKAEENLAVHLGPKRATVCATMNAFPQLQETFATEEFVTLSLSGGGGASPQPQPTRDRKQPVAESRTKRHAVKALIESWKKEHADEADSRDAFNFWAQNVLGTKDNMFSPASWTPERLKVAGLQIGGGTK